MLEHRRGRSFVYSFRLTAARGVVKRYSLKTVTPRVNTEDLIDAHGVAALLRLSHANSVITYLRRYPNFPRPVIDLGSHRVKLWLRPDIERWARTYRPGS